MELEQIRQALELGFPAIVLIMLIFVWQEYKKQVNARIDDLREIAGMRPTINKKDTAKPPIAVE